MEEIIGLLKEQNDLLKELFSEIKKEPIELTIDSGNITDKLETTGQSNISQVISQL